MSYDNRRRLYTIFFPFGWLINRFLYRRMMRRTLALERELLPHLLPASAPIPVWDGKRSEVERLRDQNWANAGKALKEKISGNHLDLGSYGGLRAEMQHQCDEAFCAKCGSRGLRFDILEGRETYNADHTFQVCLIAKCMTRTCTHRVVQWIRKEDAMMPRPSVFQPFLDSLKGRDIAKAERDYNIEADEKNGPPVRVYTEELLNLQRQHMMGLITTAQYHRAAVRLNGYPDLALLSKGFSTA